MGKRLLIFTVLMVAFVMAANIQAMDVKKDSALVGLWLFDDGSGTVVKDSSGKGNDGKASSDFTWDNGKFGKAIISPVAVASTIVVPKSTSLDTVTKAMTIAAWFRVDTASDAGIRRPNAFLLEDQSATEPVPDSFSFRMWTSKGLSPGVYGKTKLVQKTWNHVAGTYDGKLMKLYINGVEEKDVTDSAVPGNKITGEWSGDVGTPADALQLKFASEAYIGGIDEIMLFNRALSASEIKEIMVGALTTTAVDSHGKLAQTWGSLKK